MAFDARNPEKNSAVPADRGSSSTALLDPPRENSHQSAVFVRRRRATDARGLDSACSAELVARANAGERAAWEALVDRYAGLVEAVAVKHRLDRDDVNDVAQVTWLRLTQHLDRLHDSERVGLWLHTTATRESRHLLARSGRTVPVELRDDPDPSAQPDELIANAERAHHLRAALGRLPGPCRTLLELMLIRDPPAPYKEISERCDIAVGTIGSRRQRCLAHLRRLYSEAFPDNSTDPGRET